MIVVIERYRIKRGVMYCTKYEHEATTGGNVTYSICHWGAFYNTVELYYNI